MRPIHPGCVKVYEVTEINNCFDIYHFPLPLKFSILYTLNQKDMSRTGSRKFSANEKEIAALLNENDSWKKRLSDAAEEINFLNKFLSADIFQNNILNLYETLRVYSSRLETFRTEGLDLTMEVHNNRYDIEGMMECEDISCEIYYHDAHLRLEQKVINFLENFNKFKLEVYSHTGGLLRKTSKEY